MAEVIPRSLSGELHSAPMRLPPIHVHVHIDPSGDGTLQAILDRLTQMETQMSDTNAALEGLTTAVQGVSSRIVEDVAHLQELLDAALATDATDQAEIARLREEATTTIASITASTDQLNAIDPVTGFPDAPVDPPA